MNRALPLALLLALLTPSCLSWAATDAIGENDPPRRELARPHDTRQVVRGTAERLPEGGWRFAFPGLLQGVDRLLTILWAEPGGEEPVVEVSESDGAPVGTEPARLLLLLRGSFAHDGISFEEERRHRIPHARADPGEHLVVLLTWESNGPALGVLGDFVLLRTYPARVAWYAPGQSGHREARAELDLDWRVRSRTHDVADRAVLYLVALPLDIVMFPVTFLVLCVTGID